MSTPVHSIGSLEPLVDHQREGLLDCLASAETLEGVDTSTCQWLRQKLQAQQFSVVVAGQFKRGKSSVINALLGANVLPTGVVPLTSIVTILEHGASPGAEVLYQDGLRQSVAVGTLVDYVTERGNPRNEKRVEHVIVRYPSAWLADGVRLIDTPGIASVYEHNTEVTRAYLPHADALLFVISADQPMSRAELDFLTSTRAYADRTLCLLNKSDYLSIEELKEALSFTDQAVRHALAGTVPVLGVSARNALAALENDRPALPRAFDGFSQFTAALNQLLKQERHATWVRSIGRTLLRVLSQARFAAQLERDALKAPLQRVEAAIDLLNTGRTRLRQSLDDYSTLLERDALRFMSDYVEPQLNECRSTQAARLPERITSWSEELSSLTGGKLVEALQGRTDATIKAECDICRADLEQRLAESFETACQRFWQPLQQELDALIQSCGQLFQVEFEPVNTESLWQLDSRFYYKFWSEPPLLHTLSRSIVETLPDVLGRHLAVRQVTRRAEELVTVQMGRLRADFGERLRQSVAQFRQRMTTLSEQLLDQLTSTVEGAVSVRQQSGEAAQRRERLLEIRVESSHTLEAQIRSILAMGSH